MTNYLQFGSSMLFLTENYNNREEQHSHDVSHSIDIKRQYSVLSAVEVRSTKTAI